MTFERREVELQAISDGPTGGNAMRQAMPPDGQPKKLGTAALASGSSAA
jgi:hypothetical protein